MTLRDMTIETTQLDAARLLLAQAESGEVPLIERALYLARFDSELDEFFSTRYAALKSRRADDRLAACRERIQALQKEFDSVCRDLFPALSEEAGVRLHRIDTWDDHERNLATSIFRHYGEPLKENLREASEPGDDLRSGQAFLVIAADDEGQEFTHYVPLPPSWERLHRIPHQEAQFAMRVDEEGNPMFKAVGPRSEEFGFILFEDVLRYCPGRFVVGTRKYHAFLMRLQRDERPQGEGDIVRLQHEGHVPESVLEAVGDWLGVAPEDRFRFGYLPIAQDLRAFDRIELAPHRYPDLPTIEPPALSEAVRSAVGEKDRLLCLPFNRVRPVGRLVEEAKGDGALQGITALLGRLEQDVTVLQSLRRTAQGRKPVVVLSPEVALEIPAPSHRNLLEADGIQLEVPVAPPRGHFVLLEREGNRIACIGTGTFDAVRGHPDSDMILLTADDDITGDLRILVDVLRGEETEAAPRECALGEGVRLTLIDLIERETNRVKRGETGRIILKTNHLDDPVLADALRDAAEGEVEVDLIVRGACAVAPRENLRVHRVLDRVVERIRAMHVRNGGPEAGEPETFLMAVDCTTDDLSRAGALMVPLKDEGVAERVRAHLYRQLFDNQTRWIFQPDGTSTRVRIQEGESPFHSRHAFEKKLRGEDV